MGAAAKFGGEITHLNYTHTVTVLLAEQGHGACLFGFLQGHDLGHDREGSLDLLIDQVFHFLDLFSSHG